MRLLVPIQLLRTALRLPARQLYLLAAHRIHVKLGLYRPLTPAEPWAAQVPTWAKTGRTPFSGTLPEKVGTPSTALARGERILAGELCYFSHTWLARGDWNADPRDGRKSTGGHWTESQAPDDLKWVWEASRFDWVWDLARAYAVSRDARYARGFWDMLASWRAANPPNQGINWQCAQECSYRMFALAWGAEVFAGHETDDERCRLYETIGALTRRIIPTLGYALGQDNNHALAEVAAVWSGCACLPDYQPGKDFRDLSRVLERLVERQFRPDGTYLQQSLVYHRSAIQDVMIGALAMATAGTPLEEDVLNRVDKAADFLASILDPVTGEAPNFGANDGTNIFALSGRPYGDMRPVVAAWRHFRETGEFNPWLADVAVTPVTVKADDGGCYQLVQPHSRVFIRCQNYRERPVQADGLHVDLWIPGRCLAMDGGTFSYWPEDALGRHLESTAAHNTVTIDGKSQMPKIGTFLWADWTRAGVDTVEQGHFRGSLKANGVRHTREVRATADGWQVEDKLVSLDGRDHEYDLRWHLDPEFKMVASATSELTLDLQNVARVTISADQPAEPRFLDASVDSVETARSPTYGLRTSCAFASLKVPAGQSARFVTTFKVVNRP